MSTAFSSSGTSSTSGHEHAQVLQTCIQVALAEGRGIAQRWVQGLVTALRACESDADSYGDKTSIALASKELRDHRQHLESSFVLQWERSIDEAIKGAAIGNVSTARRSLAHIRFDELELMNDDQVQATVEVARVQQAVQIASEQSLADLSSRLSRAQGFGVVRLDQNPLRPEVVIQALSRALEDVCKSPATRGLWLQHGTRALAAELDVLYRYLRRVLDEHGVTPADYAVTQSPNAPTTARASAAGAGLGAGRVWAGQAGFSPLMGHESAADPGWNAAFAGHDPAGTGADGDAAHMGGEPPGFRPSSLLTLNHLHRLMSSGHALGSGGDAGPVSRRADLLAPSSVLPTEPAAARVPPSAPTPAPASAPAVPNAPLPPIYMGVERRRRDRSRQPPKEAIDPNESGQLGELAEEVVGMMLDGIHGDQRLLPPVRDALQRLRPLFLRIARDNPRFFADKQNPARQLLDEMTQQSLAFSSVRSQGFDPFLSSLQKVVESLVHTSGRGPALINQALNALRTEVAPEDTEARIQAQRRAVSTLMQAEQRFLLAEKVALEMQARPDYAQAPPFMQQFLSGPWAQVVAWARLMRTSDEPLDGRLSADVRYTSLVSNLLWSCRPEEAGRTRGRLVSIIPVMLRNLREGLQTIEYPQEKSCDFFNQLMVLHDSALKTSMATPAAAPAQLAQPAQMPAFTAPRAEAEIWISPSETRQTGFMAAAPAPSSPAAQAAAPSPSAANPLAFADTQPLSVPMPLGGYSPEPEMTMAVADLTVGSWIEWLQPSGEWQRAKLSWASPQGTMYLFIVTGGKSMSMTRRSFEAMCQRQTVRMISTQSMVDDALDGVMDAAMRNSTGRTST